MVMAELDVAHISSYCSIPQSTVHTLLDAPSAELVQALLRSVTAKAREYDEIRSEKLKLDVELENAVRGGESKTRVLKASVDKSLKEAAEIKQKLQAEENSRTSLVSEFEALKSSTSSSVSEISTLKARISSLESSNRDTLSLLESKSSAYDQLVVELSAQHQKIVELRREVSGLEQSVQSTEAASSSAKFREQSLQQEIEHLKRNNDWLDGEIKTKSEEHSKYRKEKGSRIAELQRQNDEMISKTEALTRTENNLRTRLEEVEQVADNSMAKVQQLEEETASKEEAFRIELDAANRLAELMSNSVETERRRHQDLSQELEAAREDAAEQIGRINSEIETEHQDREAAEQRVADLEVQVESLEADLETLRKQGSAPGSPHPGINGHAFGTPVRLGLPASIFSPNSSRVKGGLNFTQLYSEFNKVTAELETEKRRNEKITSTLDDMIQDMETRQPEVEELRADHGRLEADIVEMSALVDSIGKERDQALKEARKNASELDAMVKEGELLRQQLRDLSSQIKVLLMEVHLGEVSVEERIKLEQLAQSMPDEDPVDGRTDTDKYISEHLTTFRDVAGLQEQNRKLLKLTRELGDRMEGEEAQRNQSQTAQDKEELGDLRQKLERCKDEMKSLVTQSQSYIRERDMFRRMLSHRGSLPPGSDLASMFGESVNGGELPSTPQNNSMVNNMEQSPSSKDMADYAKLLKDMQNHFDAYRHEAATDRSTLKEQVDSLSKTNGELRSEVMRGNSQVTLAHQRYEMLQANYMMLKNENGELQKRAAFLSDTAARQDLRTQQVAEDLVEAKGLLESIRNETANLKAEKHFRATVEKRLVEDNEALLNERSRQSSLTTNLQSLLNERELSDTEMRRRLQGQIESLEKELQATNRQLSEQVEDSKRATLRRELDHQQSQSRIDDLISSLGSVREELIAAKTTRDHLQTRVDEMTIELRSAEERAQALQSTSKSQAATKDGAEAQTEHTSSDDSGLSNEQELALQVSDLKRDLELAKRELQNVKGQVEQYKAISQASEEELQSLNETQDHYRQDTDRVIGEKDVKIQELEQRVTDISSELSTTNSQLSTLRTEQAGIERRLDEQKTAYEAELAQLKDQDDRHAAAAQFHQEDLKVQAEIAQQAQQNYENELVKHAEAAKTLQRVRSDLNNLKVEAVEFKTDADSARASLSQSEESWTESRERYEREIMDLKKGREELNAQNKRLHLQLDNVSNQISSLQKRGLPDENEDTTDNKLAPDMDNLQQVIKYLRREKEIVDVQWELSAQEARRLKQQLDHTQSQLDETRLKLNQQRRLEEDSERSLLNHNKLIETINELNLFRESSVTLRNEARQAQALLAEKSKEVDDLIKQVQPLQVEIQELKNERDTQEGEMRIVKEDRDRWEKRTQNILQKYERIDPAELEALKEQIETMRSERDEVISSKQPMQEQIDSIPEQIKQAEEAINEKLHEVRLRLTDQFKARSRDLTGKLKEKDGVLQAATKEKEVLEQQVKGLQQELEAAKVERDQALETAASNQQKNADYNARDGTEEGQVEEDGAVTPAEADMKRFQERLQAAEARCSEEATRSQVLQGEATAAQSKVAELERLIVEMQQRLDATNTQLTRLQNQQQEQASTLPTSNSNIQLEELRQDLAQAQEDLEKLRTAASISTSLASASTEDGSKSIAGQVTEQVEAIRAELESRHNSRVHQLEESFKKRSESLKAQLLSKLAEGKNQFREMLEDEHAQALQMLKTTHNQEIEGLIVRHKEELDELRQAENTRFKEFKEAWLVENSKSNDPSESTAKSESQPSGRKWEPSEAEAKELVATNTTVKEIVKRNISSKLGQEREALIARVKEEQQGKAMVEKEQAVNMMEKKYNVKTSMAENRAKASQAKLDVVQKAATETPETPVSEVWAVAKNARPLPPANVQGPQQGTDGQKITQATTSFGKPSAPVQPPQQENLDGRKVSLTASPFSTPPAATQPPSQGSVLGQKIPPTATAFGKPVPLAQIPGTTTFGKPSPPIQPFQSQPSSTISFGKPSVGLQSLHSQSSDVQPTSIQTPSQAQMPPPATRAFQTPSDQASQPSQIASTLGPSVNGTQPPASQTESGLPVKPPQSQNSQPNPGMGPAALKGFHQSGLPVASGGARGGFNPTGRGVGRGSGRGGSQQLDVNTPQTQQPGRGSPTSGRLSAGAKQFVPGVPGSKRPREEGQDGHGSGGVKRFRGGAGGTS